MAAATAAVGCGLFGVGHVHFCARVCRRLLAAVECVGIFIVAVFTTVVFMIEAIVVGVEVATDAAVLVDAVVPDFFGIGTDVWVVFVAVAVIFRKAIAVVVETADLAIGGVGQPIG